MTGRPGELRIGAIADDFTGATDLASALARGGLRVAVSVGLPAATDAEAADALIVALKIRSGTPRRPCPPRPRPRISCSAAVLPGCISSIPRRSIRVRPGTSAPSPTRSPGPHRRCCGRCLPGLPAPGSHGLSGSPVRRSATAGPGRARRSPADPAQRLICAVVAGAANAAGRRARAPAGRPRGALLRSPTRSRISGRGASGTPSPTPSPTMILSASLPPASATAW